MQFTTMDRIFTKVLRDLPGSEVDEVDIIEWTGEALEFINAIRAKEEAVAFLKVKNYQTEIPTNLHNIIQIALNTMVEDPETEAVVNEEEDEVLEPETDYPVCIDSCGMPYDDYDVAYYRPYFDLQYEYYGWRGTTAYQRCYVPVRLSNHVFFNSLVCSQDGTDCGATDIDGDVTGIYHTKTPEYTVIAGKVLRFNFEKGLIALAYNRNMQDENGLPMIPDNISFTTAIVSYIIMRQMKRELYTGRDGARGKLNEANKDWNWYVKQASNKSLIPQGVDELENIKNQRNYIIPRRNVYQNYFGNLNNKEIKNILHTERRNNAYYGSR